MSTADQTSFEFEASIDEKGKITLPSKIAGELRKSSGLIHVRLTAKALSSELKNRDVVEGEIERIGNLQLESREQVVKFLLSEGVLNKNSMRRRKH